jgi:hypothetical protein
MAFQPKINSAKITMAPNKIGQNVASYDDFKNAFNCACKAI